ncbi:MAG: type II toxin-antitoxin system Phd/YefM family antitoxin [Bacteroidia bacterium]|nr:type II toxin-antitoxin system Phd/YefM family antitoxin [Bacteroidia bacterium]
MTMVMVRDFREKMENELTKVTTQHDVLHVLRPTGDNVVVMAEQDWKAIEETIYLNQIPGMVNSIQQAATEPVEEGIELNELEW